MASAPARQNNDDARNWENLTEPRRNTNYHYVVTEIKEIERYAALLASSLHRTSHTFFIKMRLITALLVLNAAATAVGFAPPAGHGTSAVRGDAALGAKRDFLRRIFRRPSRLAAKVRKDLFQWSVRFAFLAFLHKSCCITTYTENQLIVPGEADERAFVVTNAFGSWSSTGGCAVATTGRFCFQLFIYAQIIW